LIQLVYNDQLTITIKGTGFNPLFNALRFTNGILGKGVNYTVTSATAESLTLRLAAGSRWSDGSPGYLILWAINAGEGFFKVGNTKPAMGTAVATVFEKPTVDHGFTCSSDGKLYKTRCKRLHLGGSGFTTMTKLRFDPPLNENEDYKISTFGRTLLVLTLMEGKAWRTDTGPLIVTEINSRGDEAGWISTGIQGFQVAEIIDDLEPLQIIPSDVRLYQSELRETLTITGSGFKQCMSVILDPDIKEFVDYDVDVISSHHLSLNLRKGRQWLREPGFLVAKFARVEDLSYRPLAGADGIRVATILADPVIRESRVIHHVSQSKVIAIKGSGFTSVVDTKIRIRPTSSNAYKVVSVLEDTILIQLKQDQDWLPSFMSLVGAADADKSVPLQVCGLDTGAGEIVFDEPITIGYIVKDREGDVCDDSCEFAFDGICDDGSVNDYTLDDVTACMRGTDCTDCGGVDTTNNSVNAVTGFDDDSTQGASLDSRNFPVQIIIGTMNSVFKL
jgi:hypothetical protein